MFDTMTFTKVLGAVCGSLLVFLLGNWAADALYSMDGGHGGEETQAYSIAVEGGDAAGGAAAEEGPAFAEVFAAADAAKGEKVFAKCKACHKVDGTDGTGPHLNGVVGRQIAASAGFGYSDVLKSMADKAWTPEELDHWLENPKAYAPGNKMSFAGLPKVEDRANLVAWLATQQ